VATSPRPWRGLLGPDAPGLSAATISRLKEADGREGAFHGICNRHDADGVAVAGEQRFPILAQAGHDLVVHRPPTFDDSSIIDPTNLSASPWSIAQALTRGYAATRTPGRLGGPGGLL